MLNIYYLYSAYYNVMIKSFQTLMLGATAPLLHGDCDKPFVSGYYFMKDKELWKFIPNTKSTYELSNFGKLRSWAIKGAKNNRKSLIPYILKTPIGNGGYPHTVINFLELGRVKTVRLHQWVAKLFIPNPNNYPHVLHKDDNKLNAHHSNLEWGTQAKNNRDAFIRGRITPAKGIARKKSNLTENDVMDIFKSTIVCRELAVKYNVNHTCISDIRSGRSWNHITGLLCTRKIKPKYSKDVKFK